MKKLYISHISMLILSLMLDVFLLCFAVIGMEQYLGFAWTIVIGVAFGLLLVISTIIGSISHFVKSYDRLIKIRRDNA